LHHNNAPSHTPFFTGEFFLPDNTTVVPQPTYFVVFSRVKIKPKERHFDTIEVMEAESQAVLNTVTEHYFQDAFKQGQKHWKRRRRA
jgi:hypothetical protein